jgi:tetratricopeptide (TPR) repeat protein
MRILRISTLILIAVIRSLTLSAGNETEVEKALSNVDLLLDNGDIKKAIKTLDKAINLYPQNAELLSTRSGLFILMDRSKEAKRDAYAAIQADPYSCRANFAMSQFHIMQDASDSALWCINRAKNMIADDSMKESVFGLKGKIHLERNELYDAESALIEAGLCQEVSMNTMRDLATALHMRGKDEEAIIILKETLDMFGEDMESYINAGYMCNQVGRYDEAITYLTEALALESTQPFALSNLAYSQLMIGHAEEALKTVKQSLDNDNSNAFAYKVKGQILEQMGEPALACKEYKKAVLMGYGVLYDVKEISLLIISACNTE